jgi:hypothetical protein
MSRIDVVKGTIEEKGKVKVLVNFGCIAAFTYSTIAIANQEATKLKENKYPHASLNLLANR